MCGSLCFATYMHIITHHNARVASAVNRGMVTDSQRGLFLWINHRAPQIPSPPNSLRNESYCAGYQNPTPLRLQLLHPSTRRHPSLTFPSWQLSWLLRGSSRVLWLRVSLLYVLVRSLASVEWTLRWQTVRYASITLCSGYALMTPYIRTYQDRTSNQS